MRLSFWTTPWSRTTTACSSEHRQKGEGDSDEHAVVVLDQGVVQNDNRMLVGISFAFLAVCLLNTVGILLAKFLNSAAIAGVRRALGASRRQIFMQHLVEVGVLATAGALLGLVLGAVGLWGVHAL